MSVAVTATRSEMNSVPAETGMSLEESQAPSSWHSCVRWLGAADSFPCCLPKG